MRRPHSRTGRQRWSVIFQKPVTTFGGSNAAPTTSWLNFYTTWAEIDQTAGDEPVWRQQVQQEENITIRCRWFSGARMPMRVIHGGRIFNVNQIRDVGSLHQMWEIGATEIDPEI